MSPNDAITLVTKMHLEPGDILVVDMPDAPRLDDREFWLSWNAAVAALPPAAQERLKSTLIVMRDEDDPAFGFADDAYARRLYDALKRRFHG